MKAQVSPPTGRIRIGRAKDADEVRRITEAVFTVFGEYGSWLPDYLTHPGVWTYVYAEEGRILGFAMLGVLDTDETDATRLGDLLAIAVRPSDQGRGVGTLLLERIVEKANRLHEAIKLREVRLTVAEPNDGARRLFDRFGFVPLQGDHGFYDKGQRALRLGLKL